MRKLLVLATAVTASLVAACAVSTSLAAVPEAQPAEVLDAILEPIEQAEVQSPSEALTVVLTTPDQTPKWQAFWNGKEITTPSALGFTFAKSRDMEDGLVLTSVRKSSKDETWEQPWGERQFVRDHHNELTADFAFTDGEPAYTLRVRVFDDGFAFRYEVDGEGERWITEELTDFGLDQTAKAWWIKAGAYNRYEYLYKTTTVFDVHRAHTPFTAKLPDGPFISIHEAALVDYAGMWLNQRREGVLQADLAPRSDGIKVKTGGSFKTPWRTVQVSDTAAGLGNSDMILNLNEPNKLGDVSWVKPSKYIGIWWCMHIAECTWGSGDKHGATTERTRDYIDFAAEHGFDGILVEGWNIGWDGDWFSNGELFSFTEAYPDFDIEGLAEYAREKGVYLIGHHETSGNLTNYERQMEDAYALYQRLGIPAVKTGYVADAGDLVRRDETGKKFYEWHDGQFAVEHHMKAVKTAAKYGISINAHEPVKDTGLRRTYPNWMTREGVRGQEFNAWGVPPNTPEHTTIIPFTRMLSGPADYTPGIFDLSFGNPLSEDPRVQTTLAKQLALYVVLYSPIQMAADLPRNYTARPDAFQFIKDVPVDWQDTIVLDGLPGEYVVIARKDRNSEAWFLGAITDEEARTVSISLDFLDDLPYEAQIYRDGEGADWRSNPYAFETAFETVDASGALTLDLAPGGGTAIAFIPVE
ncbi:MAG: glycoside hydrolase family 97 protein [Henriciella sp.]|nr:glycoside hydrolase family 97 protein [Henriciella sp.]